MANHWQITIIAEYCFESGPGKALDGSIKDSFPYLHTPNYLQNYPEFVASIQLLLQS